MQKCEFCAGKWLLQQIASLPPSYMTSDNTVVPVSKEFINKYWLNREKERQNNTKNPHKREQRKDQNDIRESNYNDSSLVKLLCPFTKTMKCNTPVPVACDIVLLLALVNLFWWRMATCTSGGMIEGCG